MLAHPDLVIEAPHPYFGLRAIGVWPNGRGKPGRPTHKHSMEEIAQALDRSPRTIQSYLRIGTTNANARESLRMPQYASAYMALLDNAHPTHVLVANAMVSTKAAAQQTQLPREPAAWVWAERLPPVPRATYGQVRDLMAHHGMGERDVVEAFNFDDDNRQYSVRTLGNDGVRWMLLRLMTDDMRPALYVRERTPVDPLVEGWVPGQTRVKRRSAADYPPPEPVGVWPVTHQRVRRWAACQLSESPEVVVHASGAPTRPATYNTWTRANQKDWERWVYLQRTNPALVQQAVEIASSVVEFLGQPDE